MSNNNNTFAKELFRQDGVIPSWIKENVVDGGGALDGIVYQLGNDRVKTCVLTGTNGRMYFYCVGYVLTKENGWKVITSYTESSTSETPDLHDRTLQRLIMLIDGA
jgi:hypothetical protein